jgi:uncharacterized protein
VRGFGAVLIGAAILAGAPAAGQSQSAVMEARGAGRIGERFDGYMGAPGPLTGVVRSQFDAVNIQRRSIFTDLATRRGVSPGDVGITFGCTLLRRVAVGEVYLLPDNVWRRRGPGEPSPRPDYCPGN